LVTHGGVPLADLWPTINEPADFDRPLCLQDFTWNRAHERAKTRIVSRMSKGCEFGHDDFAKFCVIASECLGQQVKRMIRGHDHVEHRYAIFEKYEPNSMLTINTFCRRTREAFGPDVRKPCIARWRKSQTPEVYQFEIPDAFVAQAFGLEIE